VIRLDELAEFMSGGRQLPARSVVITIDDGYESVHRHAYPAAARFGFPATLFVYPDFVGAGDAMSWAQLRELAATGLSRHPVALEVAPQPGRPAPPTRATSSTAQCRRPSCAARAACSRHACRDSAVDQIAIRFGDANLLVVDAAAPMATQLGPDVVPAATPSTRSRCCCGATMIFGDLDLEGFRARLQTQRSLRAP